MTMQAVSNLVFQSIAPIPGLMAPLAVTLHVLAIRSLRVRLRHEARGEKDQGRGTTSSNNL